MLCSTMHPVYRIDVCSYLAFKKNMSPSDSTLVLVLVFNHKKMHELLFLQLVLEHFLGEQFLLGQLQHCLISLVASMIVTSILRLTKEAGLAPLQHLGAWQDALPMDSSWTP